MIDLTLLDVNGFVVVDDVFTEEICKRAVDICETVYSENAKSYANINVESNHLADKSTEKVVYNLHNKSDIFWRFFEHPIIKEAGDYLLKSGSYLGSEPYYLNNISARTPLLGNVGQQLHTDSNLPGNNNCLVMNVLCVLEPFTLENGATRVIPASHKRECYPEEGVIYEDEVRIVAPAGSVIIFNAGLWHGSGANVNGSSRWALVLGYARWFIKPSFDFMKNTPREIFENMTDAQKSLLGFDLVPPKDEFTRLRRRSKYYEEPEDYSLPNQKRMR